MAFTPKQLTQAATNLAKPTGKLLNPVQLHLQPSNYNRRGMVRQVGKAVSTSPKLKKLAKKNAVRAAKAAAQTQVQAPAAPVKLPKWAKTTVTSGAGYLKQAGEFAATHPTAVGAGAIGLGVLGAAALARGIYRRRERARMGY